MFNFSEGQILKLLGKLANEWGTGHNSITRILSNIENFLDKHSNKLKSLDKVKLLIAMLKDHSNQKFKVEDGALGMIIACLAYIILPSDVVPDFIPIAGFADDAAALKLAWDQIRGEIKRYKLWQENQLIDKAE